MLTIGGMDSISFYDLRKGDLVPVRPDKTGLDQYRMNVSKGTVVSIALWLVSVLFRPTPPSTGECLRPPMKSLSPFIPTLMTQVALACLLEVVLFTYVYSLLRSFSSRQVCKVIMQPFGTDMPTLLFGTKNAFSRFILKIKPICSFLC